MFVVLVLLGLLLPVGFAIANRLAPSVAARFAFVPVRQSVVIPLPPAAADLLTPVAEAATYREHAPRALAFRAFPGAASVERGDHVIRFVPELCSVLANRWRDPSELVCVHVSAGAGGLVLRARRFPSRELWWMAWGGVLLARWNLQATSLLLVVLAVVNFAATMNRVAETFNAAVAEIRSRVAVANGDPPPPPPPRPPMVARFTGPDEWMCACGKVNARKRSMCGRCWAQRPDGNSPEATA
jgi:hypothetical protein